MGQMEGSLFTRLNLPRRDNRTAFKSILCSQTFWVTLAFVTLMPSTTTARAAEALEIDSSHSAVIFTWDHFGFSHPVARLEHLHGILMLVADDLSKSSIAVSLTVADLRSGDAEIDGLMKSASYLDVGRYPTITFDSTTVDRAIDGSLAVSGNLTIHGITKAVTLKARINKIGLNPLSHRLTAGFDADAIIKRSDFGISQFIPSVADKLAVHITLDAHAARQQKRHP